MKASVGRGCLYLSLSIFLFAAVLWFARVALLTAAGNALVEDDGVQKADAAVVLGGDGFGTRVIKAAELARAGYVPIVLVSGPVTILGYESDRTIQFAEKQGYPASMFHALPSEVDSTRSEAVYLGRYLKSCGFHKILLVTSNYHTRRASSLMRENNPWLQVIAVPAPDPFFTAGTWWKTRTGQKTFAMEWMKTVATWLKF